MLDARAADALLASRRTCLRMDPDRAVDPATIGELCRLATLAPNHHRTEPWRFAVCTGDGRRALGDVLAGELGQAGAPPERIAKTRVKYLRAPAMVLVGAAAGPDALTTEENRDAVAAAVQNLLLGATARGLATFWSSVAAPRSPALLDLCGFEDDAVVIAAVYLGHPTATCPPPGRSGPRVRWIG
jgi:nitroreductase